MKRRQWQCDGCDLTFNTRAGLKFEYTIMKPNNQYVWCTECQKEYIPEVKVERHGGTWHGN